MLHQSSNSLKQQVPKIGDIVLVKETDLRREEWKLDRVEAIGVRDSGHVKEVTVILPNRKRLERSDGLLYSIRCARLSSLIDSEF